MQNKKSNSINSKVNYKNPNIEATIISASKFSKTSEIKVYFKNIPAKEYSLGYKNFCGIKINNFAFYNPSLFDLYPKIIDYLFIEHKEDFLKCISDISIKDIFISNNENIFEKTKPIIKSSLYLNTNLSFNEMITALDKLTELIFNASVLKILTLPSIKN